MKTKVKNLSDTKIEITITLDAKDLSQAKEAATARLAKEIKLEGFRKGKAPIELAKKAISRDELASATIDYAVRTTVPKAFTEASKQPLVIPNVNVTKYVIDEMAEYTAVAEIMPEIELGDYKALKTKKPEVKVSEDNVKEILENIRSSRAEQKVVNREAKEGDDVIIDYSGKKDGVAFAGGTAKDQHLLLGGHMFIPGFEEGIIGHKVGDEFDLTLTFPKDYHAKALAGAKTVFTILVKQINEIIKPELNDDFAKSFSEEFKTLEDLKQDIRTNIQKQNEIRALDEYKDKLVEELIDKSKVSAPEILVDDQYRVLKNDMENNAASRGVDLNTYIEKTTGDKFEKWEKEAKEIATGRVKAMLILQTLANKEKIIVTDEEVDAKISELKDVYKKSKEAIESLKNPNVKNDIKNRMTIDKTLDYLVKTNS